MADDDQQNLMEEDSSASFGSRVSNRAQEAWANIWVRRVVLTIVVIAIIIGLIFAIRAIHHASDKNAGKPTTGQGTNRPGAAGTGNSSTSGGTTNGGGSNTRNGSTTTPTQAGGTSGSKPSTTAAGPSLKSGQQLTNTGPGDVIAIFLATTFVVGGLHYIVSLRRES